MDIVTLRITFSLVVLCMLVLFYLTTYRTTRAPFCGWWCLSLVCFLGSGIAWLLNGTGAQVVSNPTGNVLAVLGATAVWLAGRSLSRTSPPLWQLAVIPLLTALAAALGHPRTDIWAGGLVYLLGVSLLLGLATRETWRARPTSDDLSPAYSPVTGALALICGFVALFYLGRALAFAAVGPHDPLFTSLFGTAATTLLTTVLLVGVSHSMGALSHEQLVRDLRHRAERDDLSGLLNREAFWTIADKAVRGVPSSAVIIADLDHFKQVNDAFGHSVGDEVITVFADAIRYATRSTDLSARFGGEEFVILMPGASTAAANALTQGLSRLLSEGTALPAGRTVTVSYGIAVVSHGISVADALQQADEALYRAKSAGRDQAITFSD